MKLCGSIPATRPSPASCEASSVATATPSCSRGAAVGGTSGDEQAAATAENSEVREAREAQAKKERLQRLTRRKASLRYGDTLDDLTSPKEAPPKCRGKNRRAPPRPPQPPAARGSVAPPRPASPSGAPARSDAATVDAAPAEKEQQ